MKTQLFLDCISQRTEKGLSIRRRVSCQNGILREQQKTVILHRFRIGDDRAVLMH